ncbi:hypothetical protein [Mycolicibacterium sp.]|uniref:hypothetical protein n=1 Tax=Mycolicibacterium sp. TaxID=2320850 RepID=UPI0025DEF35C|nr:hypothetical protein [Mycolicibacterium sp.]
MAGTDERQALAKLGAEHGWKHLVKSESTDSFGRGNLRVRVIWHDTEKINGAVYFEDDMYENYSRELSKVQSWLRR